MLLPLLTIAQRGGKGGYGGDFSGFGSKKKSSYFRGNVSGKIVDSNTGEGLEYALKVYSDRDLILATGSLSVVAEVSEVLKQISPEIYPDLP